MTAFLRLQKTAAQAEPELVEATLSEQVLGHLTERGFVPFHPVLAERFGHRAALFIGVCLYWTKYGLKHAPQRGGWFHMSAKDMTAATTLSRHEQDTVRALMEDHGILEQRLAGRPAVLHYRLNLRSLASALEVVENGETAPTLDQAWNWFQGTVTFYRPLADIGGSAASGLYLSYLLRQLQQALTREGIHGELLQVEPARVARSLCLTPKVVRTARERLKRSGLVSDVGQFQRVNLGAILACLQQQTVKPLPAARNKRGSSGVPPSAAAAESASPSKSDRTMQPGGRFNSTSPESRPPSRFLSFWIGPVGCEVAANRQLDGQRASDVRLPHGARIAPFPSEDHPVAQSGKLGTAVAQTGKLADRAAQTGKLELPKAATHINTGYSIKLLPHTRVVAAMAAPAPRRRRDDQIPQERRSPQEGPSVPSDADLDGLEYPETLSRLHREGVKHVLRQVDANLRQVLLDELAGHLALPGKTINNPAGWLHRVAEQAASGCVLPLAASTAQIRAAKRKAAEREARAMSGGGVPVKRIAAAPPPPSRLRDEHLAKAKAVAAEMRMGGRR